MAKGKLLTAKQVREQGRPSLQSFNPKAVRDWIGISQAQLARMSGVSRAAIASIETGRYMMSARDGAKLFIALASAIPPESRREREKTVREAVRLLAFQRELWRKERIEIAGQLQDLKKRDTEIETLTAELDSEEARLREL